MLESQVKLREANEENFKTYLEKMPGVKPWYDGMSAVYEDGALSAKAKRLMALTGAMVHGCRACILYQTEMALEQGATVEEILETCSVAICLGGTMGAGETTRVVAFLKEKGLL